MISYFMCFHFVEINMLILRVLYYILHTEGFGSDFGLDDKRHKVGYKQL